MEIQHFSHMKHTLRLIDVSEEVEAPLCKCCKYLIRGHAYTCRHCDFWLHKVCAELPSEIDSFHPHKLSLYPRLPHSYFICNACEDLNLAFVYHCVSCNFSLDVKCAALKDGQCSSKRFKAKDKVKKISGHRHPLVRCNIRKELEIICVACQQLISDDLGYFHLFLSNYQILLHESCIHIPEVVHTHPFHQQHSLHRVLLVNGTYRTCKACWMPIQGVGFECKLCQFILHVSCAYYRGRPLKHACHKHDLFYFNATKGLTSTRPRCVQCERSCTGSFYRCYKCDVNFHLKCMPLLPQIKCEVHKHPLVISTSFAEESSVDCCSCGEKRNVEQEVYACNECTYVAHIECVASGVKHFSHEHALCFSEVIDRENTPCCNACSHLIINDPASRCLCCNFWLHKSCMDLPLEIRHPHHSEHSLTLLLRVPPNDNSMDFVCDVCGDLIRGFTFHCIWCSFYLDVICALQPGVQLDPQRKGIKTTLKHFCHDQHSLIRCNIRKELGIDCVSCLGTVSGLAYACCMCKFYIDLSCLDNMPQNGKSLYHKHLLLPRAMRLKSQATCNACLTTVEGFAFWCEECKFNLHVSCINAPARALKHDCHEHGLYYFAAIKKARSAKCMVCDTSCNNSFFRCVECDFNIHLRCVPLPSSTQHKSHLHPLHFLEHVEEYHCGICETKGGREHEVYACKDCSYKAHIECAVSSSEVVPVQHFSHEHALYSTKVIDEDNAPCCNGCSHLISDSAAFYCTCCKFWLHKSCMQLPSEIQHPYHSRHRLTLLPKPPYYDSKDFICDGCGDLIRGFTFHCRWCRFYLDVKCASQQGVQLALQRKGISMTLNSFCHEHTLIGCYLRMELGIYCVSCLKTISGFAYACCVCQFYIHEPCVSNIPQEARSLYHEHRLTPRAIGPKDLLATCNACVITVMGFAFWCESCNFNLHVSCINVPTRALKHMCHKHDLYYFAATKLPRSARCKVCDMSCDHSFFRCVGCDFNFHLCCVPLPLAVKHKFHWHSLRLVDSYIEDDYLNEYYCDICETQRNVEHDVYACKDCLSVAHIECVVSQEKVRYDWHSHALFLGEVREDEKAPFCSGCGLVINDLAYACLECNFWLDKSCFDLSKEIYQHPLHLKHEHLMRLKWSSDQFFLCACGYLSNGLYYKCSSCYFVIDVICSSSSHDRLYRHGSRLASWWEINFLSDSSFEKLNLTSCSVRNYWDQKERKELLAICEICEDPIEGYAFASVECQICFHDKCLSDLLGIKISCLFHSQHHLLVGVIRRDKHVRCSACRKEIKKTVAFFCSEYCNVRFHRSCANYETRVLRHKCHNHDLLYFGPKNVNRSTRFCHSCSEECSGSFLGCIDCNFDIHLECVPLPLGVKHSRHLHPLKLTDVVENDSGDYRCNMCEGKRNPKHQVYACEDCPYIAHIDCVNSEDQTLEEVLILSYLRRQSRQLKSDSDQVKAISQLDKRGGENVAESPTLGQVKEFEALTARLVRVLQVEHSRSTVGRKLCEDVNEQESNVTQKCAREDEELVHINEKIAKIKAKMKELETLVTEVEELEGGDKMLCLKS